jgi:hypothetical protein
MKVTPAAIVTGGGPDNSLPEVPGPVDPGYGVELPPVIDNGLPDNPGVWPPQRPNFPVYPNHDLPRPPSVWPTPPVGPDNSLPTLPGHPSHPIYRPPVKPDNSLPLPPGSVWPPLPPSLDGKYLVFAWIVGVGYRFTVIDTTLDTGFPLPPVHGHPGHELPNAPVRPDAGLPPTAQPKS